MEYDKKLKVFMGNDIDQNSTLHCSTDKKFNHSKFENHSIDNLNPKIHLHEHESPTRDLQMQYNDSVDT